MNECGQQFTTINIRSMEVQAERPTDSQDNELIELIVRSFKGRTQEEVKQASDLIIKSLDNPVMIDKLISILTSPTEHKPNLKKSIALLIKKYSFQYAHAAGDKSQFIEKLYELILKNDIEIAVKEVLGLGLENVLKTDKEGRYKRVVLQKTLEIFNSGQSLQKLQSCLVIFQAFFNALSEGENQFQLFFDLIQPLNANSMSLFGQISGMSLQVFRTCDQLILPKISKTFSFLQHILQVIFEEAEEQPEVMTEIRENPFLIEVLQNFLVLFHNENSIICKQYDQINEVKRVIMNIVVILYKLSECPLKIFRLTYATFLSEATKVINDFEVQSILVLCVQVLDDHLERKVYENIFAQNKMDTLFALLLYSVTTLEEYQYIEENPEKFVEIAEDYTQANIRKDYLKIKAGSLLQLFIEKIDDALRTVVDIIIMISAEILQPENKREVPQIAENFKKYTFYNLSEELKLQTCCMVLANLSRFINKRYDLNRLVNSFLASHFPNILQVKSHLPILRIIRLVSYYPTAIYFVYIESHLTEGKIFIIEGIKSFERIIKTNRYPQLLGVLGSIFMRLMGVIRIGDPIMQIIVINHHSSMLKRQPELYRLCLQKIKQQFYLNKDSNQHSTMICFNLISALLQKEKEEEHRKEIIKIFYQIDDFLLKPENSGIFDKYEEKLIEIVDMVITIRNFSAPEIEHFVERTMRHMSRYEKGSVVFKMYNNYISKMEGAVFKLEKYFQTFWEEVKHRVQLFYEKEASLETLPYYCLLMSQIIGNNTQLSLSESDFDQILAMVGRLGQEYKQYPLLIFLSYIYEYPEQVMKYLKKKNFYRQFLEEVTNVHFEGQLPKKIIILALIRLVQIQEQLTTFQIIMEYCVKYLKLQYQKSKKVLPKLPTYQVRTRRLGEERLVDNEDLDYAENDNQLLNIFLNFKHPYRDISEYNNFKVIHSHRHGLLKQLNPSVTAEINSILSMEWVDNKTRRIVHVK